MPDADRDVRPDDWKVWFDRHQAALLLFARQFLASPEQAQDAVQEGFVHFWKSRSKAVDPAAYLFQCVRSAAIDLRRARKSRRRRETAAAQQAPAFISHPPLAGESGTDERRKLLEGAIAALPEEQREVLVLKVWSELTLAQIAAALHIPAGTAASRYRYALERLQAELAKEAMHD